MSVQSWITVRFRASPRGGPVAVVRALIAAGWRFDDHGALTYLPRAADIGDWRSSGPEDADAVWGEIAARADAGETVGLVLTWASSQIGGEFLVKGDGELLLSTSVDRRRLGESVTDVSWYLDRLRQPLAALGDVEAWNWTEVS